jgi:hypothetical protein
MLMTSGVKYGFGRTLPHLVGVILGFALMIAVVGFGLDVIFKRFPIVLPIMRVAGSLYMLWLALKIALAKPIGQVEQGGRPIGFFAAAGFQWVNPKAWAMALSPQRAPDRFALRLDLRSLRRRLGLVRRLAEPAAQRPARDAAFQLDDGRAAGRLDRADSARIEPAGPALTPAVARRRA